MKVVIIDDDKSSGKALADLLETKYDMEVLGCALCGLDGLAMVNRYQPDVLFLDVQLPDVNGLDFLDSVISASSPPEVWNNSKYRLLVCINPHNIQP